MININRVIVAPLLTEKAAIIRDEENKYVFKVDKKANKFIIKEAIEKKFSVTVEKINIVNVTGKVKRRGRFVGKRADWKKAIVTLKQGENIPVFEGV